MISVCLCVCLSTCLCLSLPPPSPLSLPPSPALPPPIYKFPFLRLCLCRCPTTQNALQGPGPGHPTCLPTCSSREASLCSVEPDLFTRSMSSRSTMVSTLKEDKWTSFWEPASYRKKTRHPDSRRPRQTQQPGRGSHFSTVSCHLKVPTTHICITK